MARLTVSTGLLFDYEHGDAIFHLCEGNWYKVEKAFADRLRKYL